MAGIPSCSCGVLAVVSTSAYQTALLHGLNSYVMSSWQLWLILVGPSFWALQTLSSLIVCLASGLRASSWFATL